MANDVLKLIPYSAEAWMRKGMILNSMRRHNEALECFTQANTIDPTDAFIYINRGLTLDNLRQYEEAIDNFDHALILDDENEDALLNKAISLEHLEQFPHAEEILTQLVEKNPEHAAWYELAFCTI